jgi:TPP-dependent pyruvate/acetoin dehydrogenase alpha subunit
LFKLRILEEGWAGESVLHKISIRAEEESRLAAEQATGEPVPDGREAAKGVYTDTITEHPWTRTDGPYRRDSSELNT